MKQWTLASHVLMIENTSHKFNFNCELNHISYICWDRKFCDKAIGGDSKSIGTTITELWIILEKYVKGLRVSLLKGY